MSTIKPVTPLPWSAVGPHTAEQHVIMSHRENLGAFKRDDAAYIVHACNAYPRLIAEREELIAALREAEKLRPMLLRSHGAVPESVLAFCNIARALLARLGEG